MEVFYSFTSSSEIVFSWINNNKAVGMCCVKQHPKDNTLWTVEYIRTIKRGLGPKIYDCAMQYLTQQGNWLTSSRGIVSIKAVNVWEYYYNNRPDVTKQVLEDQETLNTRKGQHYSFLNWKYQQGLTKTIPKLTLVTSDSSEIKQAWNLFNSWKQ